MIKQFFCIVFLLFLHRVAVSQPFTERVDGEVIKVYNSYLNSDLKKEGEAATDYIGVYQKYISGIRGAICPMYPSCSNYGLKTFSERSFIEALSLTADRMMRCGHDHANYHTTLRVNGARLLDYPYYDIPPDSLIFKPARVAFAYTDFEVDDEDVKFVKLLINQGYYSEALLEILRVKHNANRFDTELFINKMICLRMLSKHEKAIFEYQTECDAEAKENSELLYQMSLIHYQLGNISRAQWFVTRALSSCESYMKPRLIGMEGLLQARNSNFEAAAQTYQKLNSYVGFEARGKYCIEAATKEIKSKSPALAGVLGVIPGAGYLYAGHKQTALSSLIVNGLMAYACYTSFEKGNKGLGILTGVFGLSFYIGNIQGSVKSAKRYNRKQQEDKIKNLERTSIF